MRHLIQAVKDGSSLVIFPEGRLTVTGGLMKVYDGTAMIADKADAPVIPVRIDGLERSHFGYLSKSQTKKAWFPKTTVTILPPVKLNVDPNASRQAATPSGGRGAAGRDDGFGGADDADRPDAVRSARRRHGKRATPASPRSKTRSAPSSHTRS